MKEHILFVEDDAVFRGVLEREIQGFGYDVTACESGEAGLRAAAGTRYSAALLDLQLPGIAGVELLEGLHERIPGLPIVFLTGNGGLPDAVRTIRAGAYEFLVKPTPLDELELALKRALDYARLRRENFVLRSLVDRDVNHAMLGDSPGMRDLRGKIQRVGASDANVLISGENGTGKELVARGIHRASPRSKESFVVVNCGAIPSELFESELFGHRRGAFTGAERERIGLIELADNGTLFLDEISELPIKLQPALLRAVQFGEFRPVGAEQSARANVRILAATNLDLHESMRRSDFREDLYHRISTLELVVPALRERGADIQLLARAFLQKANESIAPDQARSFSSDAIRALQEHSWSGNVRELENVVVRLVTLGHGKILSAHDIERHLHRIDAPADDAKIELDLGRMERRTIIEALRRHRGHRGCAAAELGIAIKTLYNKLRHYSIAESEWS
jgi:DNA-binding NtrC family response regulator